MNSPRPKPKQAPGTEPQRKPIEATSSGVRSACTPNSETCDTAVSCRIPPTRAIRTRRPAAFGDSSTLRDLRREVGLRAGQHLDEVEAPEVGHRRDVDAPVQRPLADLQSRDLADRDAGGER